MKQYLVTAPFATVPPGTVVGFFAEDQHRRRAHLVEALGEGRFRARERLVFKHGERFAIDGEMPKAMAQEIGPAPPPKGERRSRAQRQPAPAREPPAGEDGVPAGGHSTGSGGDDTGPGTHPGGPGGEDTAPATDAGGCGQDGADEGGGAESRTLL